MLALSDRSIVKNILWTAQQMTPRKILKIKTSDLALVVNFSHQENVFLMVSLKRPYLMIYSRDQE